MGHYSKPAEFVQCYYTTRAKHIYGGGAILERTAVEFDTDKVEIQPAIDLIANNGLWPACGSGKSGGNCGDDGSGFLSPGSICFNHHMDTYPP